MMSGVAGAVLEIGDNLNTLGLALIVALPSLVTLLVGKRAKDAATEAASTAAESKDTLDTVAAQLQPNTGTSAFDKITAAQRDISAAVAALTVTVTNLADDVAHIGARVTALTTPPTEETPT